MKQTLILFFLFTITLQNFQFIGHQYESMTARDKVNLLFYELRKNIAEQSFYSNPIFEEFFKESMKPSFDYEHSDQLPPGRKKLIHTVGLIGKVKWIPAEGQPYTGVFQGNDFGLLRFNLAFPPTPQKLVPAISIKLLRDNIHSANFLGAVSLAGQKSQNFFKYAQTNHPHLPPQGQFGNTFFQITPYINLIGLKDCGQFDSNGRQVEKPKYPFQLIFEPNPDLTNDYRNGEDWVDQVRRVQPGDIPYTIYAKEFPEGPLQLIGHLQAISDFDFSYFGDKGYFIRHNRIEYDLDENPEWKPYLVPYVPAHEKLKISEEEYKACPYFY